jgi:enoyl-CoA hydratase
LAGSVTYRLEDGIATIAMDDGKANALSIEMLKEVLGAFDQAESDGAVVVFTGRERFFSGGFDLEVFSDRPGEIVEMLTLGARLSERILSFPTPVLIACPGHAIAAGTFPLLAADVRIGVDGPFKVGLNEVQIGLTVPLYVVELARQRLDPVHLNRALVTATMHSPEEAVEAGILDRVVEPGDLREAGLEEARRLAALDMTAHEATKLRVRDGALRAFRGAVEEELSQAQGPG